MFFLCLALSISMQAFSQYDFIQKPIGSGMGLPASKGVEIPLNSKFDFNKLPPSAPTYSGWDNKPEKSVDIIQKKEFVNPGEQIKEKLNQKESDDDVTFKSDRYFGDFRNNGKFVRFICRDFGEVDGDRVRVYLNDVVVEEEILLEGVYKAVRINLTNGFNKIDFQALNQGSSGPNTAEFKMFDDKGVLISSNQWNLGTGNKATLIVVKEQ